MRLSHLVIGLVLVLPMSVAGKPATSGKQVKATQQLVNQIRKDCGITTGQFSYSDEKISLNYDGMIEREKLDCANDRVTLLGVGFESYDSSAPYGGPTRFIIKGPSKRLDAVAAEAAASRWIITHRADAGDGISFLEIETGSDFTRRQVRDFLDRFVLSDLRDVAVGLAPWTLAGYDLPTTAMEFRSTARRMFEELGTRSCGTPAGFDREALLKPDHDAVTALEHDLSATPAAEHLAIAREDAAYELSKKPDRCWADDDIRFAKLHVEGVHGSVVAGTARLRQLAPAVDALPAAISPQNAAEFRYQVRRLIEWTLPLCRWTTKGSNDEIFAAGMAELGKFEARLRDSPYAAHYAIAKDDATYDRSRVEAECDDPHDTQVAKLSAEVLASSKTRIGQIERLILP